MSWQQLETADPELADFGKKYLHDQVAYLATIRQDGSPRLHPVRPVIGDGRLAGTTLANADGDDTCLGYWPGPGKGW